MDSVLKNDQEFIDLKLIFLIISNSKKFLLSIVCSVLVLSSIFYFLKQDLYQSSALLMPTENSKINTLDRSIPFLNFPGLDQQLSQSNNNSILAIEIIKSNQFFKKLIENQKILPLLIAAKSWDKKNNKIIYDRSIYDDTKNTWVGLDNGLYSPSLELAHKDFINTLVISRNKNTGFITLSYSHFSPYVARNIIEIIIREVNEEVSLMKIYESQKAVDYLTNEVSKSTYTELNNYFYELIQEYTRSLMLASLKDEYALTIVDPATLPEFPSSPKRLFLILFNVLLSIIISILLVIALFFLHNISYQKIINFFNKLF